MKTPYTYRRKSGIYYFRFTKALGQAIPRLDIRFSLKTTDASVAKIRAMTAWVCLQSLVSTGHTDSSYLRSELQHLVFSDRRLLLANSDSCTMSHHPRSTNEQQPIHQPQLIPAVNVATTEPTLVATLSEELNAYSQRKYDEERWTAKSKLEFDGIFDTFVDVVGDKPVSEITKADIQSYAAVVNYLPPNRKKMPSFRRMSAKQAAEKNRLISGDRLSVRQRKKYFTILSPLFNEFVDEGMIEFNFFNKYRGKLGGAPNPQSARHPFSVGDLRVMFESDTAIDLLKYRYQYPSRAWGCLLALFTCARAEEIFSLSIAQIKSDDGTYYFDIDASVNRVKTNAAIRAIPIHPKLIDLGFLKYVEQVRRIEKGKQVPMLFPELRSNMKHGFRRAPTRWFNEKFLVELGLKTKKKSYHSFRHCSIDKIRRERTRINGIKASQYIGHEDKSGPLWVHVYGSPFTPKELLEITDVIQYEVDFSKLKRKCLDVLLTHLR